MEAHLILESRLESIEAATDFTWRWCANLGLDHEEASQMSLAVDEILTDVLIHAYREQKGYAEIWYQYSLSELEIIIQEKGEPFDPERYRYDSQQASEKGDFEGAGLEIVRKVTDRFHFLNRGNEGKEFRLVKQFKSRHIEEIEQKKAGEAEEEKDTTVDQKYELRPVKEEDSGHVSRLIYRCYGYDYSKEDLYFPSRVERALRHENKFGVMVRTKDEIPVGYFAVIKNRDSQIGEVGEAVVIKQHRGQGLMKRMLNELIEMSQEKGLVGLYGKAMTVHTISQKVNAKFGFSSTAFIIAKSPRFYRKTSGGSDREAIGAILDFRVLAPEWNVSVYLPKLYESVLRDIYSQFDKKPVFKKLAEKPQKLEKETQLDLSFNYESNNALIIVREYGDRFERKCLQMFKSLEALKLGAIFIDLPLQNEWIDPAVEWLREQGYIFCGLMPLFHHEKDHLRMQKINLSIDFDTLETYSETAAALKELIREEYHELQKEQSEPEGRA